MEIRRITETKFSQYLLNDDKLAEIGVPDRGLAALHKYGIWTHPKDTKLVGVYTEDVLSCCVRYHKKDINTVQVHAYLSTPLQGKEILGIMFEEFKKYLKEIDSSITTIAVHTPKHSRHVIRSVLKLGFKANGQEDALKQWRQKLECFLIFNYILSRS